MAKINRADLVTKAVRGSSPMVTGVDATSTFEGAPAYTRDAKSDLFLLATTGFFGEDTFYESASARNTRFIGLVQSVAREDPAWLGAFLPWLRREANIRTAAVVGAVEAARVLAQADVPGHQVGAGRRILSETLLRADEPAEALAYHLKVYGRKLPAPVRRGIADAAVRLYTSRNYVRWDSSRAGVRMADVVELTHPSPRMNEQSDLFKYMIDSAHRRTPVPPSLKFLRAHHQMLADLAMQRTDTLDAIRHDPSLLAKSGLTWQALSSSGVMDKRAWEAIIPSMGYMALLRNLRNFQDARVSPAALKTVAMTIGDETEVRHSRQLPYRFLAAHLTATSPVWALALESALQYSTQNLPSLPGTTLVLVDTSGSMSSFMSAKSQISRMMAGALFGVALAAKGEKVDLYGFASGVFAHEVRPNAGILRTTEAFVRREGEVGHGTQISLAVHATYRGQDRVVIITDEQAFGGWRSDSSSVDGQVPANIPVYAFNLAGYAPAMLDTSSTRHQLGGLSDHTFQIISSVEAGRDGRWPWEQKK
jgi:TROVE domain-containing protein